MLGSHDGASCCKTTISKSSIARAARTAMPMDCRGNGSASTKVDMQEKGGGM